MWQEIVTINERAEPVQSTRKPPKREYVHVLFLTKDQGELEDKRAERDGKWLKSHKHGMIVPYQEPAECYGFVRGDRPPVPTGKRIVVIDSDPGTEWETELWRQGGYLDQQLSASQERTSPGAVESILQTKTNEENRVADSYCPNRSGRGDVHYTIHLIATSPSASCCRNRPYITV